MDFSSLYNSKKIRVNGTLTRAIVAADNVDRRSPSVGKAKVIKGIPKKAKLPKMVLKIRRKKVFFGNLNRKYAPVKIASATIIGVIPVRMNVRISEVNTVSAMLMKNKAGSAK